MKLTPLDIHHKEFHRAVRGYNEEEVDIFLDQIYAEFERIFKENTDFKDRLEKNESKLSQYEGIEQTLQNTLITAQKSAEEVQANAKKEADLIIRDAEMKAKQIIEDAYNQRRTLTNTLHSLNALEEDFLSHISATVKSFNDKAEKAMNEYKGIEDRIELETKQVVELGEKIQKLERGEEEAEIEETTMEEEQVETGTHEDLSEAEAEPVIEERDSEEESTEENQPEDIVQEEQAESTENDEMHSEEIADNSSHQEAAPEQDHEIDEQREEERESAVQEVKVGNVVTQNQEIRNVATEVQEAVETRAEREPAEVVATLASNEEVDRFMGQQKPDDKQDSSFLNRIKSGFMKKQDSENTSDEKRKNTEELDDI